MRTFPTGGREPEQGETADPWRRASARPGIVARRIVGEIGLGNETENHVGAKCGGKSDSSPCVHGSGWTPPVALERDRPGSGRLIINILDGFTRSTGNFGFENLRDGRSDIDVVHQADSCTALDPAS